MTATFRAQGYDAARRGDFEEATRLYQAALRAYPDTKGQLAKRDRARLGVIIANYQEAAIYATRNPPAAGGAP